MHSYWQPLIILFIVAWIGQAFLTYFQIQNYRERMADLSKKGYVGIGKKSKKLGRGRILLLVSNPHERIIHAEEMRGITVFSRFKEKEQLSGYSLSELEELELGDKDLEEAISGAVKDLRKKVNKSAEEAEKQ